jgi:hypothetical protein
LTYVRFLLRAFATICLKCRHRFFLLHDDEYGFLVISVFGGFPDLAYNSWFTIGDALGNANALGHAGSPDWGVASGVFEVGGDFLVNDEFGGAFYLLRGAAALGQRVDGRVLVGKFTSAGEVQMQANLQWRPNGAYAALQTFGLAVTLRPEVVLYLCRCYEL